MAEQHGMQPEHHNPVTEKEFFDRAGQRLDEALRNVSALEERMAKRFGKQPGPAEGDMKPAS